MDATDDGYELLDAGGGRRLERLGGRVVDRPQPGADAPPRNPDAWLLADLRYERWTGWHGVPGALDPWPISVDGLTLELRPTESGQVGLFPEHVANLAWLRDQVASGVSAGGGSARGTGPEATADAPPLVLNLFAYTGLGTLALAAAGASVVHVDSSRPAVTWARHNAELSGLAGRPIRWIVDDAEAFVAREVRRGRRYDGVILDPPSYGHDDRGRAWRLEERLPDLVAACFKLLAGPDTFVLLTAHSEGMTAGLLAALLAGATRRPARTVDAGPLEIDAASGARLDLGAFARLAGGRLGGMAR